MIKTIRFNFVLSVCCFLSSCATNLNGNVEQQLKKDLSTECVELFSTTRTKTGVEGYESRVGQRRYFAAGFEKSGKNIACGWYAGGWMRFTADEVIQGAIATCNTFMPDKTGCEIYAHDTNIVRRGDVSNKTQTDSTNNESKPEVVKETTRSKLPHCPNRPVIFECWSEYTYPSGDKFIGTRKEFDRFMRGTYVFVNGDKYVGEIVFDRMHGQGIYTFSNGIKKEGIWESGNFKREARVNFSELGEILALNSNQDKVEREQQRSVDEQKRLDKERLDREKQRERQRVNLNVIHTQPAADGSMTINIQTNADTASLLVNGEEQGGRADGSYIIKKIARAGQETKFTVVATDVNGNKDTKIITVMREMIEQTVKYAQLNPTQVKEQPRRDAVAVIIGISKYESLPIAEFANDDARTFYDYAIRGLGVKPENIKLLIDENAREAEILKAFRTWLPSRVKSTTDVFVFYSGHGLPTPDGSGLYLLPLQADREVIDDTAIPFAKINDAISIARPKSVTVIIDACYSGQTKAGQALVASARPISLKAQTSFFPSNFTVISASQSDQISSSSPDLQHGIFSYYLMKGMEGDADMNRDGRITLGEMRDYLVENVGRQAAMMSRKQEPQLIGDVNRVLVGR
jgi:hypothetical protein